MDKIIRLPEEVWNEFLALAKKENKSRLPFAVIDLAGIKEIDPNDYVARTDLLNNYFSTTELRPFFDVLKKFNPDYIPFIVGVVSKYFDERSSAKRERSSTPTYTPTYENNIRLLLLRELGTEKFGRIIYEVKSREKTEISFFTKLAHHISKEHFKQRDLAKQNGTEFVKLTDEQLSEVEKMVGDLRGVRIILKQEVHSGEIEEISRMIMAPDVPRELFAPTEYSRKRVPNCDDTDYDPHTGNVKNRKDGIPNPRSILGDHLNGIVCYGKEAENTLEIQICMLSEYYVDDSEHDKIYKARDIDSNSFIDRIARLRRSLNMSSPIDQKTLDECAGFARIAVRKYCHHIIDSDTFINKDITGEQAGKDDDRLCDVAVNLYYKYLLKRLLPLADKYRREIPEIAEAYSEIESDEIAEAYQLKGIDEITFEDVRDMFGVKNVQKNPHRFKINEDTREKIVQVRRAPQLHSKINGKRRGPSGTIRH